MPEHVLRFTERDRHLAAAAIFKVRHPGFSYMRGTDTWAYDYACAALAAVENKPESTDGSER